MQEPAATIVTAANQRYWRCLYQFLERAERNAIHRGHRILAYDLGLKSATLARLERRFSWCRFEHFSFEKYPDHLAMAAGSYAFKPLILAELMEKLSGLVLWLDSATLFHTRDLSFLWQIIRRDGLYVLRGQTALEERCDPIVLGQLKVPFFIRQKPELAAGVIGLDAAAPHIRALVQEWAAHALIKERIAPRIPRLSFHRPEQALLTYLVYREEEKGALSIRDEEIDISSPAPVHWMTSRNFYPPGMPGWAGPLLRAWYGAYKTVDQAIWKMKRWRKGRLAGFHRRLKERFTVLIRDDTGKVWRVVAPAGCYYADPFLVRHAGCRALLLECFDYATCKGRLCAIALDQNLQAENPISILPRRHHAAFPCVFVHEGRLYMVPETCQDRTVEIHVCEEFPGRWRPASLALSNIDAADTVIFPRDGFWWLITSVRGDGGARHLEIHFTCDLIAGPWKPHPINEEKLYQDRLYSSGRNGGAVIAQDDLLLRPVQDSHRYCGEGLCLMQIEELTPTRYRERVFEGVHLAQDVVRSWSPHHLSIDGDWMVFDIRDRARSDGLWGYPIPPRPAPVGDIVIPLSRL